MYVSWSKFCIPFIHGYLLFYLHSHGKYIYIYTEICIYFYKNVFIWHMFHVIPFSPYKWTALWLTWIAEQTQLWQWLGLEQNENHFWNRLYWISCIMLGFIINDSSFKVRSFLYSKRNTGGSDQHKIELFAIERAKHSLGSVVF